jgi:hypothetical protein
MSSSSRLRLHQLYQLTHQDLRIPFRDDVDAAILPGLRVYLPFMGK